MEIILKMQATLERTEIKNREVKKEITNLYTLLRNLETADNVTKNEIENKMVSLGEAAVPELIEQLQNIKGVVRGTIAMVLIRMGDCTVSHLLSAAKANKEFDWMAQYLISEIKGSEKIAA